MRGCWTPPARRRGCAPCIPAPAFVRRGVGRQIIELCEAAARAEGFTRTELGATAGGEPLYRACGYAEIERMDVPTPMGVTVPITRMGKKL